MPDTDRKPCLDIYGEIALSQAQRILCFGDREAGSPNYGCFDRYYWHYRQIDFSVARFQATALYMALLYHYQYPNNRFYQKPVLKDWAQACVDFWGGIQVKDGSFNECWPNERSFAATAYSTFTVAEACRLLLLNPPQDALRKACDWLASHKKETESHQMACAASALLSTGLLLEDKKLQNNAEIKLEQVLSMQDGEGFFPEYDGFDLGKQTQTLSCLAQWQVECPAPAVESAMAKAFRYMDDKINADGTFDYQSMQCQTQYFFPYGFAVAGEWGLLSRHLHGLESNTVIQPGWFDDRNCLVLSIDYLRTACFIQNRIVHP